MVCKALSSGLGLIVEDVNACFVKTKWMLLLDVVHFIHLYERVVSQFGRKLRRNFFDQRSV